MIKYFSKIYMYQKFYINNENLLFSKFQHKIMGKLCGLGKSWGQHCVKNTIPLQNMLNVEIFLKNSIFFGKCKKKCDRENLQIGKFQYIITENCSILGKSEGHVVFRTSFRSRTCINFERVLKKSSFLLASVIDCDQYIMVDLSI